jgi:hypothetical protein
MKEEKRIISPNRRTSYAIINTDWKSHHIQATKEGKNQTALAKGEGIARLLTTLGAIMRNRFVYLYRNKQTTG